MEQDASFPLALFASLRRIREGTSMNIRDLSIIGALVAILWSLLWFQVTDLLTEHRVVGMQVSIHSARLSSLEARVTNLEQADKELRDMLREHRVATESQGK